jgi:hypothetical protein
MIQVCPSQAAAAVAATRTGCGGLPLTHWVYRGPSAVDVKVDGGFCASNWLNTSVISLCVTRAKGTSIRLSYTKDVYLHDCLVEIQRLLGVVFLDRVGVARGWIVVWSVYEANAGSAGVLSLSSSSGLRHSSGFMYWFIVRAVVPTIVSISKCEPVSASITDHRDLDGLCESVTKPAPTDGSHVARMQHAHCRRIVGDQCIGQFPGDVQHRVIWEQRDSTFVGPNKRLFEAGVVLIVYCFPAAVYMGWVKTYNDRIKRGW